MKLGIFTLHRSHNFGSAMQAFALYQFLHQSGHSPEIIDYRPLYSKIGPTPFRDLYHRFLNMIHYFKRNQQSNAFIHKKIKLSSRSYYSFFQLFINPPACDLYVVGGDQLWNTYYKCGRDAVFKLRFIKGVRKIAYGTSMGRNNYSPDEIRKIASKVSDFTAIGLRENSSVASLLGHGLKPAHVADPVLLLDRSDYEKIAIKPPMKDYLLVYLVEASPLLDAAVLKFSQRLKLKVIHVSGMKQQCSCDKMIKSPAPTEVLGLLLHASFVICASYHATLFSILFHKNFVTLLPNIHTNARIEELLHQVGLKDRILTMESQMDRFVEQIDFEKTDAILNPFIKNSKSFLTKSLQPH